MALMAFELTDDHQKIWEEAYTFSKEVVEPVIGEYEEACRYPLKIFREMGRRGWLGFNIPEEYGGSERDTISYVMLIEALTEGSSSASVGLIVDTHCLASETVRLFGNEYLKEKYLPKLANAELVGGFAITEANAGSNVTNIRATAIKDGDEYVLNGEKSIVVGGEVADLLVASFRVVSDDGNDKITAFLVDTRNPGVEREPVDCIGLKACGLAKFRFKDVRVPEENVLGDIGKGIRVALSVLDFGRIGVASVALGITGAALAHAVEYAKKRVQFGQPIIKFQGLRWLLADLRVEFDAAKLLTLRAAYLRDKGVRYTAEAAMAKLYATELAMRATIKAIQVYGYHGYLKSSPLGRLMNDAKGLEMAEGTSEIQRIVIAREFLGD